MPEVAFPDMPGDMHDDMEKEDVGDGAADDLSTPVKPVMKDASTQYEWPKGSRRNMKIQTNFRMGKPHCRSKEVQAGPLTASVATSCHRLGPKRLHTSSTPQNSEDEDTGDEFSGDLDEHNVSSYDPHQDEEVPSDDENDDDIVFSQGNHVDEEKFIVFKSCLLELFLTCPICTNHCSVEEGHRLGSKIVVHQKCTLSTCNYERTWSSQPMYGSIPAGNLQLSGAILFTGVSATKTLRTLRSMNIVSISTSTYFDHLNKFLQPTVLHVWKQEQSKVVDVLANMPGGLILGGDGRSDSPGHSAKYGSYSVLEERINKVVDIQLVQSNEVSSSVAMEKEGLIRSMDFLQSQCGLLIQAIITDRHPQIQKWVRENMPDTAHYYDVWHVAKGVTKKLTALSQQKDCEDVHAWIKSVSNHLYWCASSTPDGTAEVIVAKWKSLINHIQNVHDGHSDIFPTCVHENLDETLRKKKWLKPSTKSCEKLTEIIMNTRLCNDVKKLSPLHQTSNVEAFHSLILHFCPKMTSFSYKGMLCRLHLAALHFNENSSRPLATSADGGIAYVLKFPKYKKGGYTITTKKTKATYGYATQLMKTLCNEVVLQPQDFSLVNELSIPAPLCSTFARPEKSVAISEHSSRFNDITNIY